MTNERTPIEPVDPHRERRTWLVLAMLGLLVAALAVTLGWRIIEGRLAEARKLDEAIALLGQSDGAIGALDALLAGGAREATPGQVRDTAALADAARERLARARDLAAIDLERMTDDEREQAQLAEAAIDARLALIDAVAPVFSASETSAGVSALRPEQLTAARSARERVREADDALRLR